MYKGQDDKIIRDIDGSVNVDSGGTSNLILKVDPDLQQRNRIFKDGSNLVSQITDKAQGITFVAESGEEPIYNYGDSTSSGYPYWDFDGSKVVKNQGFGAIGNTFTFEFWIYFNVVTGTPIIFGCDKSSPRGWFVQFSNPSFYIYDGVANYIRLSNDVIVADEWNHILIQQTVNNKTAFVLNGILTNKLTTSFQPFNNVNNNPFTIGGRPSSLFLDGKLKGLNIYSSVLFDHDSASIGEKVFTAKEPFFYLKRYKEDGFKKLFFSSRYLKDADINSTNEITSIYDEFGYLIPYAVAKPVINKGFEVDTAKGFFIPQSTIFDVINFTSNNWFVGFWIKPNSVSGTARYVVSDTLFGIYNGSVIHYDGTTFFYNSTINAVIGKWVFLWFIRKGDVLYMGDSGKLTYSSTYTKIIDNLQLRIGGGANCDATIDDVLINNGDSIVDPTGFAVGQKVFEPPRRRSLDS